MVAYPIMQLSKLLLLLFGCVQFMLSLGGSPQNQIGQLSTLWNMFLILWLPESPGFSGQKKTWIISEFQSPMLLCNLCDWSTLSVKFQENRERTSLGHPSSILCTEQSIFRPYLSAPLSRFSWCEVIAIITGISLHSDRKFFIVKIPWCWQFSSATRAGLQRAGGKEEDKQQSLYSVAHRDSLHWSPWQKDGLKFMLLSLLFLAISTACRSST